MPTLCWRFKLSNISGLRSVKASVVLMAIRADLITGFEEPRLLSGEVSFKQKLAYEASRSSLEPSPQRSYCRLIVKAILVYYIYRAMRYIISVLDSKRIKQRS